MNQGIKTIIYPAKDIARAKALFSRLLGVEPFIDSPYYVGFKVGDQGRQTDCDRKRRRGQSHRTHSVAVIHAGRFFSLQP